MDNLKTISMWDRKRGKINIIVMLLALVISAAAIAESPNGPYFLNSSISKISSSGEAVDITGTFEINEDFSRSSLKVESSHMSFESFDFSGDIRKFHVKGNFIKNQENKIVFFEGKYLGQMVNASDAENFVFVFSNKELAFTAVVSRPSKSTSNLIKKVEQIVGPK